MAKKKKMSSQEKSLTICAILKDFGHFLSSEDLEFFLDTRAYKTIGTEFMTKIAELQSGRKINPNDNLTINLETNTAMLWSNVSNEQLNNRIEKKRISELNELRSNISNMPLEERKRKLSEIESAFARCSTNEAYEASKKFEILVEVLSSNSNLVSIEDLILYCAFRSQTNLYMYTRTEEVNAGRINTSKMNNCYECYDGNGDSVVSFDGVDWIRIAHMKFPIEVEPFNKKEMCSKAIMQMFKAYRILNSKSDKKRFIPLRKGTFRQFNLTEDQYSYEKMSNALHSKTVWQNMDYTQIDEWISQEIITREELMQAFEGGMILPRDIAIINELGIIPEISEKAQLNEQAQNSQLFAKLLLYTRGKAKIEDIEKFLEEYPEQRNFIDTNMIEELSLGFHKFDARNSLYSLLVHDILDYDQSMVLIRKMKEDRKLTDADEEYLKKGIHDFKVNQLINMQQSAPFKSWKNCKISTSFGRLTIDPNVRRDYFENMGSVKSIFIGNSLLIGIGHSSTSRNSLDGYQLLVIPDKGVGILEKFFETKHEDGKIVYKKDKDGNLIPTIENATYVMPIEKAAEYATRRNKRDLTNSGNVKKVYHTRNWSKALEASMEAIAPKYAKFDRDTSDKWAKIIADNYDGLCVL